MTPYYEDDAVTLCMTTDVKWYDAQRNLADLAHYMAHVMRSSALEVAYAIEKPWKHEDVWAECQAVLPLAASIEGDVE